MNILIQDPNTNYRLLDSGNGARLEQFGGNTIVKPDFTCLWQQQASPELWKRAAATCIKDKEGLWTWKTTSSFKEPWLFTYHLPSTNQQKAPSITCMLRHAQSKNIGIFPEQSAHWSWMVNTINSVPYSPMVLNLFGYTGGASLVAAAAGAQVCHVDASKAAVSWARENQELSKLGQSPIRWIVDDCSDFVRREIKREVLYDALIIDPPAFGRDQKGKVFEFEKRILQLLELCQKVLKPKPLFIIFNGYSMGYSAVILKNLLAQFYPSKTIECGELHLKEYDTNRTVPCSIYARFNMGK